MDDDEGITWIDEAGRSPPEEAPPRPWSGPLVSFAAGAVLGAGLFPADTEAELLFHGLGGALAGYLVWIVLGVMVRGSLRPAPGEPEA
jgi:hypothetical protein